MTKNKIKNFLKQYYCRHILTTETNAREEGNSRKVSIKKYCDKCGKNFPVTSHDWRINELERTVDHLSSVARNLTDLIKKS